MHTRITQIVKESGLTKTDFAKKLGLSQPFISKICTGDSVPSDRTISDICRLFDVEEDWLRYGLAPMRASRTEEEEIAEMVAKALTGSDDFKKAVIRIICPRTPEQLKVLEEALRAVAESL